MGFRDVAHGGVVLGMHRAQFQLDEGEKATLVSSLSGRAELAAFSIRRKIQDAGDGVAVWITTEPERDCLVRALEDASVDPQHFTGDLPALLEASRMPITTPFD